MGSSVWDICKQSLYVFVRKSRWNIAYYGRWEWGCMWGCGDFTVNTMIYKYLTVELYFRWSIWKVRRETEVNLSRYIMSFSFFVLLAISTYFCDILLLVPLVQSIMWVPNFPVISKVFIRVYGSISPIITLLPFLEVTWGDFQFVSSYSVI